MLVREVVKFLVRSFYILHVRFTSVTVVYSYVIARKYVTVCNFTVCDQILVSWWKNAKFYAWIDSIISVFQHKNDKYNPSGQFSGESFFRLLLDANQMECAKKLHLDSVGIDLRP